MSNEYTIVIEKDEDDNYVGSVPSLLGCHTQGKSIDQLLERCKRRLHSGSRSRDKTLRVRLNW